MTSPAASRNRIAAVLLLLYCCTAFTSATPSHTIAPSNSSFPDSEHWSVHLRTLSQSTLDACLKTAKVTYVKRGDASYEALRQRNENSAFANKYPQHIISPSSEAQVVAVLRCLNKFKTPFVVRSGGHSYRGMSLLDCGAVIDLYNMKSVRFNRDGTVTVGAGMRLGPLYRLLWQKGGKMFPAGSCPAVGLSGLLLSAGKSIASRKLGFSIDSVVSARVALVDGRVVTASATQNDLFYGIRGGSGSFGIVVSWTLKVYAAPKAYTQLEISWPWSDDTAVKVGQAMFDAKPWDWPEAVSIVRMWYQPGKVSPIRVAVHYWGTKAEMQAFMNATAFFSSIPAYEVILFKQGSYMDAQLRAAALGSNKVYTLNDFKDSRVVKLSGPRAYLSTYIPQPIPPAGIDVMIKFANGGGQVSMMFLGGAIRRFSGTAVDAHRNQLLLIQFLASGAGGESKIATLTQQFQPYHEGQQYLGYIGAVPTGADPWKVFLGATSAKLQEIRAKYDPGQRLGAITLPSCK